MFFGVVYRVICENQQLEIIDENPSLNPLKFGNIILCVFVCGANYILILYKIIKLADWNQPKS